MSENQKNIYDDALDIFSFFKEEAEVNRFIVYLFDELENEIEKNENNDKYIPSIFFNSKAKVFNVNWHFLVDKLSEFCNSTYVKDDYYLSEGLPNLANIKALWFGLFVFKYSIGYYSFFGKYTPANLPVYMPIVFERNGIKKQMSSVNFYASKVKEICGQIALERVVKSLSNLDVNMVAFGKIESLKHPCETM
ncbi:MAG: hypothetical protein PHE67_00095 [Campylobacterales bacterium]|nr:hypothetical protein [Campylobacterales bacterium]